MCVDLILLLWQLLARVREYLQFHIFGEARAHVMSAGKNG